MDAVTIKAKQQRHGVSRRLIGSTTKLSAETALPRAFAIVEAARSSARTEHSRRPTVHSDSSMLLRITVLAHPRKPIRECRLGFHPQCELLRSSPPAVAASDPSPVAASASISYNPLKVPASIKPGVSTPPDAERSTSHSGLSQEEDRMQKGQRS